MFDSLKYFNRVNYLKKVTLKLIISALITCLWNFTNIFYGTVFLFYFLFSIFHLLLRFSENPLVTIILLFTVFIDVFLLNDLPKNDLLSKPRRDILYYWSFTLPYLIWYLYLSELYFHSTSTENSSLTSNFF